MIRLRAGLGFAALVAAVLACPAHAAPDDDEIATALFARTNHLRAMSDLQALTTEPRLTSAAQRFAEYMAGTDRYGHQADGRQPADRAQAHGYDNCLVAENIAFASNDNGFDADDLAALLFDGWTTSPPHRRNLLDGELTEVGIATAYSARSDRYYAVQLFGRPRSMATRFDLINASGATVTYQLGNRNYELAPGVVRSHLQCRRASLSLQGSRNTITPDNGARYRIERSGDAVRLQAE